MSDIFQEVDEEVRRDKAAEFWKKYQNQILAAAVLIVLAAAGFRYWQYERERATQAAGDQFQQALTALEGGKLDEAKAGLDKIAAQGPSGYPGARPNDRGRRRGEQGPAGRDRRLRRHLWRRRDRSAVARHRPLARCALAGRTSPASSRRAKRR